MVRLSTFELHQSLSLPDVQSHAFHFRRSPFLQHPKSGGVPAGMTNASPTRAAPTPPPPGADDLRLRLRCGHG
eukprot:670131-Prymnesium_polylepis.1